MRTYVVLFSGTGVASKLKRHTLGCRKKFRRRVPVVSVAGPAMVFASATEATAASVAATRAASRSAATTESASVVATGIVVAHVAVAIAVVASGVVAQIAVAVVGTTGIIGIVSAMYVCFPFLCLSLLLLLLHAALLPSIS